MKAGQEYMIKKHGKFLEGHSYATLVGYKFSWTRNPSKARIFKAGVSDGALEMCQQLTGGKVVSADDELNKQTGGGA